MKLLQRALGELRRVQVLLKNKQLKNAAAMAARAYRNILSALVQLKKMKTPLASKNCCFGRCRFRNQMVCCAKPGDHETRQPDTNIYWRKCSHYEKWDGSKCMANPNQNFAPEGYFVPSQQHIVNLLGGCDRKAANLGMDGKCKKCSESEVCRAVFKGAHQNRVIIIKQQGLTGYKSVDLATGAIGRFATRPVTPLRIYIRVAQPRVALLPNEVRNSMAKSWQMPYLDRIWLRCPVGQRWNSASCTGSARLFNNLTEADKACPAGYRLPTLLELFHIMGFAMSKSVTDFHGTDFIYGGCANPPLCKNLFGASEAGIYWSSTVGRFPDEKWMANFGKPGYIKSKKRMEKAKVRCVRRQ